MVQTYGRPLLLNPQLPFPKRGTILPLKTKNAFTSHAVDATLLENTGHLSFQFMKILLQNLGVWKLTLFFSNTIKQDKLEV